MAAGRIDHARTPTHPGTTGPPASPGNALGGPQAAPRRAPPRARNVSHRTSLPMSLRHQRNPCPT